MLTLLKKIRYRLLSVRDLRRYLPYAIGEILLVMVGILLALQVNNWNEEKKKVETIKVYLNSLIEDLQDDIDEYERWEKRCIFRYYSTQYLLKLCGEPLYDPSPDGHSVIPWQRNNIWPDPIPEDYHKEFIQLAFLWTHRIEGKDINSSTIEELKSTGEYSYLRQEIKNVLNEYYTDWNWRFGPKAHGYARNIVEEWQGLLMDKGIFNSNPFVKDEPIDILKNAPALTGRLRGLASEATWQSMSAKIIYEKAKNAQDLLKQELERI